MARAAGRLENPEENPLLSEFLAATVRCSLCRGMPCGFKCLLYSQTDNERTNYHCVNPSQANSLWTYHLGARVWSEIVTPSTKITPLGRWLHTAVVTTKEGSTSPAMYVFGGVSQQLKLLNDVWKLDLHKYEWTDVSSTACRVMPLLHCQFLTMSSCNAWAFLCTTGHAGLFHRFHVSRAQRRYVYVC